MSNQSSSHRLLKDVTQHDNSRKAVDFMSGQAVRQIELKKICFVDDSKTSAYVTKKLLSQQGFSVDHFADAETALEALMENDYDLVITDLMISADGGVNGDDLIRLIRLSGHPKKSLIPIMVVTGASDASIYDDLIAAGANRVLPKPLNEQSLHEAIVALTPKVVEFGPADHLSLTDESLTESPAEEAKTIVRKAEPQQTKVVETRIETPPDPFLKSELLDLDLNSASDNAFTAGVNTQSKSKKSSKPKVKSEIATPKIPKSEPLKRAASTQKRKSPVLSPKPEFDIPVLTRVVDSNAPKAPVEKEKEREKILTQKLTLEEVDEKVTISSRETVPSDRSLSKPKASARKDEISESMVLSIQDELMHIDEVAAHNAKLEKNEVAAQIPARKPIAQQQKAQEPPVQSPVQKPVVQIPEPQEPVPQVAPVAKVITPEPVVAAVEKEITAAKSINNTVEDNPLLDLLSHMDQPNSNANLSGTSKKKAKPSGGLSTGFWIILVLIMVIPASVFWYLSQQAIDVKVVEVKQAAIHSEISVPGRVVSKRNIKVSARAAGQIVEVKVKEGTKVKKGQTMARMDDKEAKSNVKRAQARLISSQEDVAATSKTQQRLIRALELGAVSRQIVEDAEAAWKSASAKQTEIEEELIGAELKLDRLQIKAPFSGLITSLSVQEGQWLSIAEPILSIVDMSQRVVEIRVDVSDSARLNVGQEVILSSEAFDGKTWKEKITKIGEEAKTEGSVNIIKVNASLGRKAPRLRIGQQVDAEIRVASKNNALLLPHSVLFTHNGSPHAAVIENAKIVFIPVVTGIESVLQVEVLKGLRAGQEVIISTGVPLEEGMNAIVTNSKRTIN